MRKIFKTLAVTTLLSVLLCTVIFADNVVALNDLVDNMDAYNGETVTVEGEVIGETLRRGEYAWININDGTNAMGIWLKTSDTEAITGYGDYKNVGDTVRVTGIFSKSCGEHGGEPDIHCSSFQIVEKGRAVNETLSPHKIAAAALLFSAALLLSLLFFLRKARK